jgi:hypothetical protein
MRDIEKLPKSRRKMHKQTSPVKRTSANEDRWDMNFSVAVGTTRTIASENHSQVSSSKTTQNTNVSAIATASKRELARKVTAYSDANVVMYA